MKAPEIMEKLKAGETVRVPSQYGMVLLRELDRLPETNYVLDCVHDKGVTTVKMRERFS